MLAWRPWKSLRSAYRLWRARERRCLAAIHKLERRYLELRRVVEAAHLEPDQGILQAARLVLDQYPDPVGPKGRDPVEKAFAILGKSFLRTAPALLQQELQRHACQSDAVCREYEILGARLTFAEKVIGILCRNPSSSLKQALHLALISPEAAWLTYQLRERRQAECRARENCQVGGWQGEWPSAAGGANCFITPCPPPLKKNFR